MKFAGTELRKRAEAAEASSLVAANKLAVAEKKLAEQKKQLEDFRVWVVAVTQTVKNIQNLTESAGKAHLAVKGDDLATEWFAQISVHLEKLHKKMVETTTGDMK